MTGIYKIENNINHKIYIGKALNINKRFGDHKRLAYYKDASSYEYPLYRAIRKYGIENFNFSVVEECLPDDLIEKEIYWISYYKAFGPQGYNQTPGGDGSPKVNHQLAITLFNNGYTIEELSDYFNASLITIKNVLHQYNLGYMTQEEKDKLQQPKSVQQYDLNGNYLNEYYSAGDASRKLKIQNFITGRNNILCACNDHTTSYNFLWKFSEDTTDMKQVASNRKENIQKRLEHVSKAVLKRCSKQVNQYDLNGKYLQTFSSATEAGRFLGKTHGHIAEVCRGKWKTAYNFIWRYTSDNYPIGQNLNNIELV